MPRAKRGNRSKRASRAQPIKAYRAFDPRRVGSLETDAWVTYYRREWLRFLRAAIGLTRHTFGLPWHETLYGSWLVLRANQLWAPFPDNDPDGARRTMERFYAMLKRRHREAFDPATAARLEVEWWRVHREHQHAEQDDGDGPLVDEERAALVRSYAALLAGVHRVG